MMEQEDRLPDSFWSKEELRQMAIDVLEPDKYSEEPTHIVLYHLYKNGADTGLVLITAVQSVLDGQDAIDRLWAEFGIRSIVGEYSEESVLNHVRVDALYLLLQRYRYEGKIKPVVHQKVFKYQEWMPYLIQN